MHKIITSLMIAIFISLGVVNSYGQGLLDELPPLNIVQVTYEAIPKIGDDLKETAKRLEEFDKKEERPHTHDSGVYYESKKLHDNNFRNFNFTFKEGSLRRNFERLAKKYKWQMIWELDTDFTIPSGFTYRGLKLPEHVAMITKHIPIKTHFYTKNKVVLFMPMYDKPESGVGEKFSLSAKY